MEMTADSPCAVTGKITFKQVKSQVTSAAVMPAPGSLASPSLEQGLGVRLCTSHLEQVKAEPGWTPWAPCWLSWTCIPPPRSGGLCHTLGQGQGCPVNPGSTVGLRSPGSWL